MSSAISAFAALVNHVTGNRQKRDIGEALLAIPKQTIPDSDLLEKGVDLLVERHLKTLKKGKNGAALKVLMRLGYRFWQEAFEESPEDTALDKDNPDSPSRPERPFEWTPDRVAKGIEHVIKRSAHMIRRARWFCMLSESTFSWTSPRIAPSSKFLLMLEKGRVVKNKIVPLTTPSPEPAGAKNAWLLRKQAFDLMTYDRLRILTTELRRLVADNREIELRVGPRVVLNRNRLARLLFWV